MFIEGYQTQVADKGNACSVIVRSIAGTQTAAFTDLGTAGVAAITPTQQTQAVAAAATLQLGLPERAGCQDRPDSEAQTAQSCNGSVEPSRAIETRAHLSPSCYHRKDRATTHLGVGGFQKL